MPALSPSMTSLSGPDPTILPQPWAHFPQRKTNHIQGSNMSPRWRRPCPAYLNRQDFIVWTGRDYLGHHLDNPRHRYHHGCRPCTADLGNGPLQGEARARSRTLAPNLCIHDLPLYSDVGFNQLSKVAEPLCLLREVQGRWMSDCCPTSYPKFLREPWTQSVSLRINP